MVCTLNTDNMSSKIHPKIKIRIRIYKKEKKKNLPGRKTRENTLIFHVFLILESLKIIQDKYA